MLVRFYDAEERAQLARVATEFQLQLVRVLRDPADQAASQALTSLRAQRELAEARLEERTLRAPADGTVSDVRIRPGQQLQPGDPILSLVAPDAPCVIVAMLPGHMRPQLKPGMSLRLELDGYRYAYRDVVVDAVGDEIIGPAELRRYLGPELADTIQVNGPTLLVRAHLPTSTFAANGRPTTTTTACRRAPRCGCAPRACSSRWCRGSRPCSRAAMDELLRRFPVLARLGRFGRERRIPIVRQPSATECGVACLAMVLAVPRQDEPLDKLRDAVGVSRDGASALGILGAARRFGLEGRGVKLEVEELRSTSPPARCCTGSSTTSWSSSGCGPTASRSSIRRTAAAWCARTSYDAPSPASRWCFDKSRHVRARRAAPARPAGALPEAA